MVKPSQKEGSLIWFLVLSFALNAGAILSGYWMQIPRGVNVVQLTDIDFDDLPPKGDPEAEQQPEQPPQPEPTPPPEPEPTPPPLDKPPEFEIPVPTPTPIASPQARPKPSLKPPKQPAPSRPNPAATPGTKGLATGVDGGTGKGGSRSGLFLHQPKPPYPIAAREMQITGDVTVTLTISSGRIVAAHGNGPTILASAAANWIRANWVPAPNTSGTYELPIVFRLD
jgi:Gram-negative bacterial TonB protein C-terminal